MEKRGGGEGRGKTIRAEDVAVGAAGVVINDVGGGKFPHPC